MPSRPAEVLRTFVALVPSEATVHALAAEGQRIALADRAARTVPRENLHLTLAFVGATPAQAVSRIAEALERAVVGVDPVRIRPAGLSAFPNRSAPRVVFASLAPDAHLVLEALAGRVREALAAAGHRTDPAERTPSPSSHFHITLARFQPPSPSPALKKILTAGALHGTYTDDMITNVRLMSSEPASGSSSSRRRVESSQRWVDSSRERVDSTHERFYRVLASFPLRSSAAGAKPSSRNPSSASAGRA